jgi:hypothetical protein
MTERNYGTRDALLESDSLITEDVYLPEPINAWYRVKGLTGAERERYERSLGTIKNGVWRSSANGQSLARLCALSVVDEKGAKLFSEEDISKLAQKNAAILTRISDVARRLSGLTEEDIEDLEGNSESAQSESSTSSSPSLSGAASTSSSTPSPAES